MIRGRLVMRYLGTALIRAVVGALVAVVVVDYTDANASHVAVDFVIVGIGVLGGLVLTLPMRRRAAAERLRAVMRRSSSDRPAPPR
jgi:hypothetical protein